MGEDSNDYTPNKVLRACRVAFTLYISMTQRLDRVAIVTRSSSNDRPTWKSRFSIHHSHLRIELVAAFAAVFSGAHRSR